jgi:hypothetical protein
VVRPKRANNVPLEFSQNCKIAYEKRTAPELLVEDFG